MVLDILQDHISFQKLQFSSINVILLFLATYLIWMSLRIHWKKRSNDSWPPGPVGVPIVGYLPFLGKEPHKSLWKLKEKYGDIIGLYMGTKYTVVLNEYSVVKETLTQPGALDRAPKLFEHIPLVGFIAANGDEWQEQRRFCLSSARDLGLGRGAWENIIMV
ncbi:Cytochrome P450 2C23, partial [Stegodyphus mimosarum]